MKTIGGDERCRCWENNCSFEGDDRHDEYPSANPAKDYLMSKDIQ
jgi:hypothetical protein